jgi:hypothetical protein
MDAPRTTMAIDETRPTTIPLKGGATRQAMTMGTVKMEVLRPLTIFWGLSAKNINTTMMVIVMMAAGFWEILMLMRYTRNKQANAIPAMIVAKAVDSRFKKEKFPVTSMKMLLIMIMARVVTIIKIKMRFNDFLRRVDVPSFKLMRKCSRIMFRNDAIALHLTTRI